MAGVAIGVRTVNPIKTSTAPFFFGLGLLTGLRRGFLKPRMGRQHKCHYMSGPGKRPICSIRNKNVNVNVTKGIWMLIGKAFAMVLT